MLLMGLTSDQAAIDVQLIHFVLVVRILTSFIPKEFTCKFFVCENSHSEVLEARWAQIWHRVTLFVVMELSPLWVSDSVSLLYIDVESVHVRWQHCGGI